MGSVSLLVTKKNLPDIATPNLNAPPTTPKAKRNANVVQPHTRATSNMSVYTLELEGGRFYVGYTDDVPRRIAEHFMGRGSHWTRTHPPVKVLEVVPGNKELENAATIALMCRHGWRNVRGGLWCSVEMRSMPTPLARALAQKPPREIPDTTGYSYDHRDHLIHVQQDDTWVARVTGPLTLNTRAKTFKANAEAAVKEAAEEWIQQHDTPETAN